jgi:ferrous iron transport protein B
VGVDFSRAALLTVQETINILPRIINLVPLVNIGEVSFFPGDEEMVDLTRLESALINSYAVSSGSTAAAPVAAVAFNVFVLLYVPCVSAVSAMRQEFGTRWMWAQIGYTLVLAWAAAVVVFQIGINFYI